MMQQCIPTSAKQLKRWYAVVKKAEWDRLEDVRKIYLTAMPKL